MCVPPDFQDWIDGLGIPVTPIGRELRKATASSPPAAMAPPSPERRRQLAEASVAAQFKTVAAAAGGCDIIVGATAFQIAVWSAATKMGIPYVFAAYFGFGSMRASQDLGQVMIQTARALGRREIVSRGWADLSVADNEPDCLAIDEVNHSLTCALEDALQPEVAARAGSIATLVRRDGAWAAAERL